MKSSHIHLIGISGDEREHVTEVIYEETMPENFPDIMIGPNP